MRSCLTSRNLSSKIPIPYLKIHKYEVFLGLWEHEVRSNPCLMPICRAAHKYSAARYVKGVEQAIKFTSVYLRGKQA